MRASIAAVGLVSIALAACPGGGDDDANPARLYLALMGSELMVQLVEEEPPPF